MSGILEMIAMGVIVVVCFAVGLKIGNKSVRNRGRRRK